MPNGYGRIDSDGMVTITLAKSEMEQGVCNHAPLLVDKELGVDPSNVIIGSVSRAARRSFFVVFCRILVLSGALETSGALAGIHTRLPREHQFFHVLRGFPGTICSAKPARLC